MMKKITAGVLCAALGITLCGCKKMKLLSEDGTPPPPASNKTVTLSEDGKLSITRRDIGDTPMGGDDWTVFVYMSGAELEGYNGKASQDMDEMRAAATGKNVRFVVQIGGAEEWKNDYAGAENLERFVISGGKAEKVASLPLASMGEASTLRNFLDWGVKNYPAGKMGVIFWGHGMGSTVGVCRDDLFGRDTLSLEELDNAFAAVSENMTDKFEFVGFDACYMATLEAADILASYAEHMIASQELEPGDGWNYTAIGDLLGSEPHADWNKIAETVCDTFTEDSVNSSFAEMMTLSVIDLTLIDDVIIKLNDYAYELCEKLNTKEALREFRSYLESAEHFGEYTTRVGHSNAADLADAVRAGSGYTDRAKAAVEAIENAVIYKRNGKDHRNACGLSVCYEFEPRGLSEIRTVGRLSSSPYFLALIDRTLRCVSPAYDVAEHDADKLAELWCADKNNASDMLFDYWGGEPSSDAYKNTKGKSSFVKFAEDFAPELYGRYSVSLEPSALKNIASVGIYVCRSMPSYKYRCLGIKLCANADWQTGRFSDEFDGKWFMLPDREPLMISPCFSENGSMFYGAAVEYDEKETTLFFSHDGAFKTVLDGFRTIREDGGLGYAPLNTGDALSPLYELGTFENDLFGSESGEVHTFSGKPELLYDFLPDGNYFYMIVITDIWGDVFQTDITNFSITDGRLGEPLPREDG